MQKENLFVLSKLYISHYEPRRGMLPTEVTNLHFYGTIILPYLMKLQKTEPKGYPPKTILWNLVNQLISEPALKSVFLAKSCSELDSEEVKIAKILKRVNHLFSINYITYLNFITFWSTLISHPSNQ